MAIPITASAKSSSNKSNAHSAIEVIPLPEAITYIQNLPVFVHDYYANCHEIGELFPALAEPLRAVNHQQLHAKDALMARAVFLKQEVLILARASEKQSRMQATLQSIDNGLDVKLDRLNAWKKVSAIFFTLAAAISAAGAVTAVNVNPKRIAAAAVATAATVLIGAIGRWIHSLLKEPQSAVRKNRDMIRAMVRGAKIVIDNLAVVCDLASDLEREIASFVKETDGATDEYVKEKMLALSKRFRKLQREANRCSSDVISAREAVLRSIVRNSG